jgi:hypothetical protein
VKYLKQLGEIMDGIEKIMDGERILSLIIRSTVAPDSTVFVTPDEFYQQAGFIVYPAGGKIANHLHKPIERKLIGTPETLFIRKGKIEVRFYNDDHELKAKSILQTGDVLMLVNGGHGFTMLEDTIMLEIKQGPYTGLVEKERFDDLSE